MVLLMGYIFYQTQELQQCGAKIIALPIKHYHSIKTGIFLISRKCLIKLIYLCLEKNDMNLWSDVDHPC